MSEERATRLNRESLIALLQSYSVDTVIRSFYARGIGEFAGHALDNESAGKLADAILAVNQEERGK